MSLILRIESYRKDAPTAPVERRFDHLGGTIGRAAGNDLELPDPGKYISRIHCKVDFADGRYTLVDLGGNPSWVNDRPLGAGKSAVLADGDRLLIGDYVLQVSVDEAPTAAPAPVFAPDYSAAYPFQSQPPKAETGVAPAYVQPGDTLSGAKILDTGAGMSGSPGADDPLGLNLFGQAGAQAAALAFRGSESDHAPPQYAAMNPAPHSEPGAAPTAIPSVAAPTPPQSPAQPLIPDDYDPLADLLAPRVPVAAPAPSQPAPPRPVAPGAATEAKPVASDNEVLRALLRGLRLPDLKPKLTAAETAELAGAMLREATAGTMSVLLARALTKRESRLELTVIGTQANNPLKFFADPESAIAQMLTNEMAGYMPPLKSFGSAFEDLKAHEMAVIAGMRAALAGVLARFDPAAIEQRAAPERALDRMLGNCRKARMWDQMVELYGQLAREAEDDFQQLFGERFSAAYEDQVGRLHQGRRQIE